MSDETIPGARTPEASDLGKTFALLGGVLAAGLAATVLAACAPSSESVRTIDRASSVVQAVNDRTNQAVGGAGAGIEGEWRLVPATLGVPVPAGVEPTLVVGNGSVSGSTGCNTFSAGAAVVADQLLLEELAVTRAACPAELAAVEEAYVAALREVASFELQDGALVLADGSGRPVLTFRR